MAIAITFMAVIGAIVAWWLSGQRLMAKSWLEQGPIGDVPGGDIVPGQPSAMVAKLGLGVFLAVVGSLFALFLSAYSMRLRLASDWQPLPAPGLLWANTSALVLSSIALHTAQTAARRWRMEGVKIGLVAGGVFAVAFLAGQLMVWQQLSAAGYFLAANPANAFFYLLTGVHGLHLLGGLVALGRTGVRVWAGSATRHQVLLSVELCALYWHFLLLLWVVLFALLSQT